MKKFLLPTIIFFLLGIYCCNTVTPVEPPITNLVKEKLDSTKQIPVVAWLGVPNNEHKLERFQEMRDAGFTMQTGFYSDISSSLTALDLAQQAGVEIIVSCPEIATQTELAVSTFKDHPAFAGYYLKDEPSKIFFSYLGEWVERINKLDNVNFTYINLFPTYGTALDLGTSSYDEYLAEFIKQVPVPIITFDHYPILHGNTIRSDFYRNLEVISKAAKQQNKPFWAFALSTAHYNYLEPTLSDLRFQVYSNLAYGAQAIQYFTYWGGLISGNIGLDTPDYPKGLKTPTYDIVKAMNAEIKALSAVFEGGEVKGDVYHTGTSIPEGTKRLTELPTGVKKLETAGSSGAIISEIKNGDYTYLIVVNRDILNDMEISIEFENKVKRVFKDRYINNVPLSTKVKVTPGDILIYRM